MQPISNWTPCLILSALPLMAPGLIAGPNDGTDWPEWRGPARDGISTETEWVAEGAAENLWSLDVGLGYSAVAIAGGRLYTTGHDREAGKDTVWCLDAETGKEVWSHTFPSKVWNQMHGGGTLSTPTVDGAVVYTLNREGNVYCFDAQTGDVRWHTDVTEDAIGAKPGTWGFAASPLVLEGDLILNVGKVVSLDKETGKLGWATKDYGHSYSTPAVFDHDGSTALAVFNSTGLAVLTASDGKELAFREWKTKYEINAATPIVTDGGIFISSGLGRGAALLRLGSKGLETVWENKSMRNKMSGCVLIDGHLYGFDESILKCIDLDGKELWSERGIGNGAVTGAPGKLLVMSAKGELIVANASPEGFEEEARAKVIDAEGVFWTMPVLSGGRIYCRGSRGQLVCRDHRGKE